MTEISVSTESSVAKKLPPAIERFVLHWGDLGGQWGVNRSVSQIHAVLYLTDEPMTAEDIAATLGMARSNVSNSLKELMAWNLVRRVPIKGDRRDHFEAETDIWQVFLRIAVGRKEREIDPAIAVLKSCVAETERGPEVSEVAGRRLKEMLAFVELMDGWYSQMLTVPKSSLAMLIRLGARVFGFLPAAKKK
jgi:DNA-binding transcriptional regulator GbsR (MarR family)